MAGAVPGPHHTHSQELIVLHSIFSDIISVA